MGESPVTGVNYDRGFMFTCRVRKRNLCWQLSLWQTPMRPSDTVGRFRGETSYIQKKKTGILSDMRTYWCKICFNSYLDRLPQRRPCLYFGHYGAFGRFWLTVAQELMGVFNGNNCQHKLQLCIFFAKNANINPLWGCVRDAENQAIACVSCVWLENRQFHVNAKLMQKCTDERGRKSWRLSEKKVCFKRPTTINLIVQSDDYGNRQLPP